MEDLLLVSYTNNGTDEVELFISHVDEEENPETKETEPCLKVEKVFKGEDAVKLYNFLLEADDDADSND